MDSSRKKHQKILEGRPYLDEYKEHLVALLLNDGLYIPAYTELLWLLEMEGDTSLYLSVLREAQMALREILTSSTVSNQIQTSWSAYEKWHAVRLLEMAKNSQTSFVKKSILAWHRNFFLHPYKNEIELINSYESTGRYLRKEETLDVSAMQAELHRLPSYMWSVATVRAREVMYHKDTYSILLRKLPAWNPEYQPLDGVHESYTTPAAELLPSIHQYVLDFAKTKNLGLGRIAVVSMKKFTQAYRHFDGEDHLQNKERYHLVLQAGPNNILTSGSDIIQAKEGELWLFNNKVTHAAYNNNPAARVHVIFDGYKL